MAVQAGLTARSQFGNAERPGHGVVGTASQKAQLLSSWIDSTMTGTSNLHHSGYIGDFGPP
jgi:hypothetical protein